MSLILASFSYSGAHLYIQVFPSTSFRQGLPESRAQGCETFGWHSSTCKTAKLLSMTVDVGTHVDITTPGHTCYLLRHCHPWFLGNCSCVALPPASVQPWIPAIPAGMTCFKILVYNDERSAWGRGNKTFTAFGALELVTANDRTHA